MSEELTSYSAIFGAVIANSRKAMNLEQGEIAERVGLSQASYSRLESGRSAFSIDQMFQCAEALGIDPNELFQQLTTTVGKLQNNSVKVEPQVRGNTSKSKQESKDNTGVKGFVVGAALTALIFGLASRGK